MALQLGNNTFFVPGAYAITKVINIGGAQLPVFNVGVIIAKQKKGKPFSVGIGASAITADQFILPYSNAADLKKDYGSDEMLTYFRYAKKMGVGTVFVLGSRPTTQCTGATVSNVTPVVALTFKSKDYGAHFNDISLTIATSIHTVIPPKNTVFLTAASGTDATIEVEEVPSDLKEGDTVYLNSNAYAAPVSKIILSIDRTLKTITFTTNIAVSALTTDYARIYQEDTDNQEVSTEALDTVAKVTAFYATSQVLEVTPATGITLMPVTLAKTLLQNLTSATKATSPEPQASDWQDIADNFERWNEEFALINKFYMRVIGLVTSDAANHSAFCALATSMRAKNKPVQIVAGCALGDYALATSNAAHPIARLKALNTDEIQVAGFGLDGLDPYLSYSGEIFGTRLANAVNHNQTRDVLVASTVEKAFFQDDADLDAYVKAGVMSILMTPTGYKIVQGVTAYQDQSTTFNPDAKKTYLVMNRDLADFDLRATLEVLDTLVGADGVTSEMISTAMVTSGNKMKDEMKYITDFKVTRIYKEGNAWKAEREVAFDSPTDFVGLTNTIVVN
jgi:hypothetical protein